MKIPVIINTALHGMILSEKLESLSESCKRNNTECGNTYSFIIQNTKMNFNTNFLSDFDHIQNIKNFTGIIIGALFFCKKGIRTDLAERNSNPIKF